ncbi:MAG: nucleoside deaminase [Gemmatimonadetes bacterium]|nr:nucleoside deaminase [Gemmatimonadota bacterium]
MKFPAIHIEYPDWVQAYVDWDSIYTTDQQRLGLAIELARQNVLHETGGPFGAAIFDSESGRLVAVGMNLVVRLHNSSLHGELVAFMMAQARLQSFTLRAAGMPAHELASSCEPCAMCLGASLWSGVRRLVFGASREDAGKLEFDEGPVFPESYAYLAARGIEVVRDVCREDARAVLELYRRRKGLIYNA